MTAIVYLDTLIAKVEPFRDDFNDGDYTGWTVNTGTWDASNHCLSKTSASGEIYQTNYDADFDLWFSYYDGDTSSASYYATVYLRDNVSYIWLRIYRDKMELLEYVSPQCGGSGDMTLDVNTDASSSQGVWYDVYVRCDGANIEVWRAQRGSGNEMTEVLDTSSATVNSTLSLRVSCTGTWRFDDFRMASDYLSSTTTYTYDEANELLTMATGGAYTDFTYDDWGRTESKSMSGHLATYEYRYGDKLKSVTTDFPDEATVAYDYDGLGKRRNRTNGNGLTWWRWTGWNAIAEYDDSDTDWDLEGLAKTYIPNPLGHGILAWIFARGDPTVRALGFSTRDHVSRKCLRRLFVL